MKKLLSVMFSTSAKFKKNERPLSDHLPDMVVSYRDRLSRDPKVLIIRTDEADSFEMEDVVRVYILEDDWIDLQLYRYKKPDLQRNTYVLCQTPQDFLVSGGTDASS